MIQIENLHVTLPSRAGAVNILRGIDLQVSAGQKLGLIGPSGSGKSTLLMVLAGLEPPTSGRVDVAGRDYRQMSEDELARFRRQHVGIVFQSFHLVPTMTAMENVALPLELSGRGDGFEAAAELLEEVGLSHRLDHYPAQMSGGEQQRVAIARALAANPPVLFADEPTGSLDGVAGEQVAALLLQMARARHASVLLATHDTQLAETHADRILRMQDGVVVEAGV